MSKRRPLLLSEDAVEDEPLINLTPLIDVVFVLLIAFMLVAPLLNVEHVALADKGPLSESVNRQSELALTIKSDSSLWYKNQPLDIKSLPVLLQAEKRRNSALVPQLFADKSCHFGVYQDVKRALEEVGFEQLDVVLR